MATSNRHSGTRRTDYETDRARLDGFQAQTADPDWLLHRLVRDSEGTVRALLENHVLTVLADIRRKELPGYAGSFADARGTAGQSRYARKLERDIREWVRRLEAFLHHGIQTLSSGSPSVEVARELLDRLQSALPESGAPHVPRGYYQMLHAVTTIRKNAGRYIARAANGSDIEPSLALLLAHIRNYTGIAELFNRRLAALPELYRKNILHAVPRAATPDNAYVVVTSTEGMGGFTFKKGTAFTAGENIIYCTTQAEYISPAQCVAAQTIHKEKDGLRLQTLHTEDTVEAETLFTGGSPLQTGWQIASPLLSMSEGERQVQIRLDLNNTSSIEENRGNNFTLQYSTAEGWTEIESRCTVQDGNLYFHFTVPPNGTVPTPCTEETHGTATEYPAVRILTQNTSNKLHIDHAQLEVEVSGICSFTFNSELGEADTTHPIAPFGINAGQGAWFVVSHEELANKPLREARLKGCWQHLPGTESAFNIIYKDYGTDAASFRIRTEAQQNGRWQSGGEEQPLFSFDRQGKLRPADIALVHNGQSHPTEGIFRVTLESPATGFGAEAYRRLFTETMMHNSRCWKWHIRPLPQEPPMPLLADVELSYKAEDAVVPTPIAVADGKLLPYTPSENTLCLAFSPVAGENRIRAYFDLALPQDRLPFYHPDKEQNNHLSWSYWNGTAWKRILTDTVTDETAGLTKSGFIEIDFNEETKHEWTDKQGRFWLRATLHGNTSSCLALRGVWTNCILLAAEGGDGTPIPIGTIQGTEEMDDRIGHILQSLPGFGGVPAETEEQYAARQGARFRHRHRVVTRKDYEEILLEHYPETELAQCLTLPKDKDRKKPEVIVVVFSRTEDSRYFLTPAWKLAEMERTLKQYAPACVRLRVENPRYERLPVKCRAVLHPDVQDEDKVRADLIAIVRNYLMPWRRDGNFPRPGQTYSIRELHSRMANHEDLQRLEDMKISGKAYPEDTEDVDDTIQGETAWSVLVPEVEIELLRAESNGQS